jgi:hypothetical protein
MAYPKIQGDRLDVALQKLREKGEASPLDSVEAFEALLNAPGRTAPKGSIEAQLLDFRMPIVKDPDMFLVNNVIRGLETLLGDILPTWSDSPEMMRLATRVIEDELKRYQDLRERLQSGIAA